MAVSPKIPIKVPTEAELRKLIMELQKKMGIPTEEEYDPLAPGGFEELYPGGPLREFDYEVT